MPASVFVCQGGCGTFEPDRSKMHARGLVNERLYCADCAIVIDEYLEKRDELHTRVAREWSEGLAALAQEYGSDEVRLPDGG